MISLTSLFFLLCVISEMVEVNERRQVSKAAMMGSVNNSKHESKQLVRPLRSDPKTWSLQRKLLKVFCPSDAIQQLLEKTATKQLAGQHFIRLGFMMLKFNLWKALMVFEHLVCFGLYSPILVKRLLSLGQTPGIHWSSHKKKYPSNLHLGLAWRLTLFSSYQDCWQREEYQNSLLLWCHTIFRYTLLRRMRKSGKNSFAFAIFVLLRYLRLTPLYAFLLFFYGIYHIIWLAKYWALFCFFVAFVIPYFGSGPVWYRTIQDTSMCTTNWWTNLLYINNFEPKHFRDLCMPW